MLYLLHPSVATCQLLPEVSDVMVVLFQVLFEVVASERQQGFFNLSVQLRTRNSFINREDIQENKRLPT